MVDNPDGAALLILDMDHAEAGRYLYAMGEIPAMARPFTICFFSPLSVDVAQKVKPGDALVMPKERTAGGSQLFPMLAEMAMDHLRKHAYEKRVRLLETVAQAARQIASTGESLETNLNHVLQMALAAVGAERGSIMLLEGNTLVVRAATNHSLIGVTQPLTAQAVASIAVREHRPILVENLGARRESHQGDRQEYKGSHFLTLPINFQGEAIGVINVTDKPDLSSFSDDDEFLLSTISGIIVTALLTSEVQKDRNNLQQLNAKLVELQGFKETMTNMLVHDLKGPVMEITGNLSILKDRAFDEFGQELMETIDIAAGELMGMIMDILDISKMEEGRFRLQQESKDVVALAKNRTEKASGMAARENKKVVFETAGESLLAMVDEAVLGRVIWNLIANANNHTGEGGRITVSVRSEGKDKVVLSVADTGVGMDKDNLERVFDKFYQGGDRRKRFSSGLGLTFCKMAVEAHGGAITVESQLGKGSTFTIILPTTLAVLPAGTQG